MNKRISSIVLAVVVGLSPTTVVSAHKPKSELLCPQWRKLALDVGFTARDYKKLDYIIWRESRCNPRSIGLNYRSDGSVWSKDWGLTQVNDYSWITYLRGKKIVSKSAQLLNPRRNLEAAYELFEYSSDRHNDAWLQWKTK